MVYGHPSVEGIFTREMRVSPFLTIAAIADIGINHTNMGIITDQNRDAMRIRWGYNGDIIKKL